MTCIGEHQEREGQRVLNVTTRHRKLVYWNINYRMHGVQTCWIKSVVAIRTALTEHVQMCRQGMAAYTRLDSTRRRGCEFIHVRYTLVENNFSFSVRLKALNMLDRKINNHWKQWRSSQLTISDAKEKKIKMNCRVKSVWIIRGTKFKLKGREKKTRGLGVDGCTQPCPWGGNCHRLTDEKRFLIWKKESRTKIKKNPDW